MVTPEVCPLVVKRNRDFPRLVPPEVDFLAGAVQSIDADWAKPFPNALVIQATEERQSILMRQPVGSLRL